MDTNKKQQELIEQIKQLNEQLKQLRAQTGEPLTSDVTGELFKRLLEKLINHAKHHREMIGVMYIDLDDFKAIIENKPEQAADDLLEKCMERFHEVLGENALIAYAGDDEFVLLIDEVKEQSQVDILAERMLEAFAKPIRLYGEMIDLGLSIGIAMFPHAGDTVDVLIKHAEMAEYMAKANGKHRFRYFTPALNQKSDRHLNIEAALHDAETDHEFFLTYEPIYNLHTNRLIAAEAILNWHSGELGFVPLSEWIHVALELNMLPRICQRELKAACNAVSTWEHPDLRLHVKISKSQFEQDEFIEQLEEIVNRLPLTTDKVIFKITENMVSTFREYHQEKLEALCEMGFKISVDQYGTGVSSISQLKHLCVNSIRVDASFVKEIGHNQESEQIIISAIRMAHGLDMLAIAVGVETDEQLTFLKHHECDMAQGPYFSKPIDDQAFRELLTHTD